MLKCGIIGCGNIAGGYDNENEREYALTHAKAYSLFENTDLIAATDPDKNQLHSFGKRWSIVNLYTESNEMLEKENLDIVSICSPPEFHYLHFNSLLNKKIKGVFCEKPLTDNIETAELLFSETKNVFVSVNFFRRWNTSFQELRKKILDNEFGTVKKCTIHYTKGIKVNGSHLIDFARWFFGDPYKVKKNRLFPYQQQDVGVDFELHFNSGLKIDFLHVPDVPYVFINIDLLTDAGRIVISQRGQIIEKFNIQHENFYKKFNIIENNKKEITNWKMSMLNAVSELSECVLGQKKTTSCTLFDGLSVMRIIERILKD